MPEIKNTFTGGKMNKDLDERLVPQGEYIDAMNVQVSTSEESSVGTVQNILGNSLCCPSDFIPNNSFTVGSISDESNDSLYWLLSGGFLGNSPSGLAANSNLQAPISLSDQILRKTTPTASNPSGCERVFVDKYGFSISNSSVDDSNSLEDFSQDLLNNIQIGTQVTGIDSFGNTSNTVSISWISSPDAYNAFYGSTPNTSNITQTYFADPNVNSASKIADKILIPALMGDGASNVPNNLTA